ncbi:uncharacterized protein BXZ73DRAFT_56765, partial [Epithele typhae]|uniref:uncharacterized protein n=2 Tax=Epithele typhae TaxID=378194 RepID=UPI002008B7F5
MARARADAPALNGHDGIKKLPQSTRKVGKRSVKIPWASRRPRAKLSYAEKKALREKSKVYKQTLNNRLDAIRDEVWDHAVSLHEDLGKHSAAWYYRLILHQSNIRFKEPRALSLWNAFVSQELCAHNQDLNTNDRVSSGFIKTLAERWAAMSNEEREDVSRDKVEELNERREERGRPVPNLAVANFNDTRATLQDVAKELNDLHERTGVEVLLFACRGDQANHLKPWVYRTSERLEEFVELFSGATLGKLAARIEAWCLTGIKGLTKKHKNTVLELKSKVGTLILEKLHATSTRGKPSAMSYLDFANRITLKYGVVLENWPVEVFQAPGRFNSLKYLNTLYSAWEGGTTAFRLLTDEEFTAW